MKIATHTLGCKLNFAETSHILRQFIQAGYESVEFNEKADLYVINTCTVTSVAEKKCRNAIRQAISLNPDAIVAVIGCYAQNEAKEVAQIPGVSIVLGNNDKHRLFEIVTTSGVISSEAGLLTMNEEPKSFSLSYSVGDRTRTFFKIQDGCDYFCTYCAIPFARGRSRSATISETIAMAKEIASSGAKEIVLTGVNTGTFGLHTKESFIDLLREFDKIDGIERFRISSIEPNLLTDEIIHFVKDSDRFAHHFHIPLQAGSDKVLKQMHRRYDTDFYRHKIKSIKALMPDCCIAADLMVGFYGEGEREFAQTLEFIDSLPLSYLHVFPYSERPNTLALKMQERVPVDERRRRCGEMLMLSEKKKREFYLQNQGKQVVVLWESDQKKGMMHGFTDNYIRVRKPFDSHSVNSIEPVILGNLDEKNDVFDLG